MNGKPFSAAGLCGFERLKEAEAKLLRARAWYSFCTGLTFEYGCTTLHTSRPDDREITPTHFHSFSFAA